MVKEIKKNLRELGFSENEIKIYIALTSLGESRASKIAKKAGLKRTTAISILDKLKDQNYLTTNKHKGAVYYWVESPDVLSDIFKNRMSIADDLSNVLSKIYRKESHFPFAKIYDTKQGIKNFIERFLIKSKKKSVIYTIDTPKEGDYRKIFSEDFENIFLNLKKKKQIITNTLIPFGSFKDILKGKIKNQSIQIREMPKEINFKASLWIVDKGVVFFSGNPPLIVFISHKGIKTGIKTIFDFLWNISELKT